MNFKKLGFSFLFIISFYNAVLAQAGACLDFDGVNDYDSTGIFFIDNTNLTLEAKVNWNGPNGKDQIIAYNGNSGSTGYGLFVKAGTNVIHVLCGGIDIFSTSFTLTTGSWTSLSAVFYSDPLFLTDSVKLYVNGNLFSKISIASPYFPGLIADRFLIGGSNVASNEFFGKIDEVRFWSKPLTFCEIRRYLNCEIPGALPNLEANYHFNQGIDGGSNPSEFMLTDDSGFLNHMNLLYFNLFGPTSNWVAPGAIVSGYTTTSPIITSTALKDTLCFGGTNKLTGAGGISYTWSDGVINNTTFTPPFLGLYNYTVTGTDLYGCTNTNIQPVLTSTLAPVLSLIKGSVVSQTFAIPDGNTLVSDWSPWVYNFTDPLPANVTIMGIDIDYEGKDQGWGGSGFNGSIYVSDELITSDPLFHTFMPYSKSANIYFPNYNYGGTNTFKFYFIGWGGWQGFLRNIVLTFRYKYNENPVITDCKNSTLTLNAFGAKSYSWSGGITNNVPFALSTTQLYTVTGTGRYGCTSIKTETVIVNSPTITVNSGTICSGQSFTIVPGGAMSYTFSSGSNVVNPTSNTSYTVLGSDALGCISSGTNNVVIDTPTITASSGTICPGKSFTIVASGAASYTYSSGSNIVSPITNTSYTISGSSAIGCFGSTTNSVTVTDTPTITVNSGSVCLGKIFTIIPSGADTYTYSSGSSAVSPSIASSYSVIGTNALGCVSKIAVSDVTVEICREDTTLKIYSGITPNGDGINDFWSIDNISLYPQNHVTIFNRWGNKLFDSSGYNNSTIYWPQNNTHLTSGTYFYVVDLGDNSKPLKGWIELIIK